MAKIIIRHYTPNDRSGVLSLIVPIQRQEFGIDIDVGEQPDLTDIPLFYQSGVGGFWVAVQHGMIVGTIGLKDMGNGHGALRKMFVAAPLRGREHRVAARLLKQLIAHARAMKVTEIFLGTAGVFLAAHRFYEKSGFVEIDRGLLPPAFPIMNVDRKFYRLSLPEPTALTPCLMDR